VSEFTVAFNAVKVPVDNKFVEIVNAVSRLLIKSVLKELNPNAEAYGIPLIVFNVIDCVLNKPPVSIPVEIRFVLKFVVIIDDAMREPVDIKFVLKEFIIALITVMDPVEIIFAFKFVKNPYVPTIELVVIAFVVNTENDADAAYKRPAEILFVLIDPNDAIPATT
jgi:hypothetical protein